MGGVATHRSLTFLPFRFSMDDFRNLLALSYIAVMCVANKRRTACMAMRLSRAIPTNERWRRATTVLLLMSLFSLTGILGRSHSRVYTLPAVDDSVGGLFAAVVFGLFVRRWVYFHR